MSEQYFTLGGERMKALALRHADSLEAGERLKLEAFARDPDVSPVELIAMMMRASLSALSSSIEMANRELGLSKADLRTFAIDGLDHLLNNGGKNV